MRREKYVRENIRREKKMRRFDELIGIRGEEKK